MKVEVGRRNKVIESFSVQIGNIYYEVLRSVRDGSVSYTFPNDIDEKLYNQIINNIETIVPQLAS